MSYDLENKNPFPLWLDPNNQLHKDQYKFMMYSLTTVYLASKYTDSMNSEQKELIDSARNYLDRGLHSCQEWWASKRPWYSPDMILRGLNELLIAAVNAKRSVPESFSETKEALDSILKDMLKAQNDLILNLN
jgi:hypothetical protein